MSEKELTKEIKFSDYDYKLDLKYEKMILEECERMHEDLENKRVYIPDYSKDAMILSYIKEEKVPLKEFIEKRKHQITCIYLREIVIKLYDMIKEEYKNISKLIELYKKIRSVSIFNNPPPTSDINNISLNVGINIEMINRVIFQDKEIISNSKELQSILAIIKRKNLGINKILAIIENLSNVIYEGQKLADFINHYSSILNQNK
ncbi:hypothetical protein A0H76_2444 [Hepatospora eriocheir]|uniref:Uncharacterized protein n=1 Tax=Hepatospora eriocheir TaxID=1081669 RepID=A0A1X0QEI4_9MICR|nr:hypothetical protein HERIO_99 [Hepatospora eriocheir]ORE00037.1 hypothetical protein A0H76_2444 [Hepatospora eriocheir]